MTAMHARYTRTAVASVALMRIRGIGRRAAVKIVDSCIETDDDVLHFFEKAARHRIDATLLLEAWKFAEDQLGRSAFAGIASIALTEPDFPPRLRNIPDPPAVLFIKGDPLGLRSRNALAVVGTREPTDFGERVAERLASSAARSGFVIVSGLAKGCDTLAHQGCVGAGGIGVAVLAHGLDKVYPAANKGLAQRLLDGGGCLVSEYPMGMTPVRTAFAERDRLQSGLSDCVLVIETDIKGGTMHTVRFALQQGRHLACIDHPEAWRSEPKVQGNRQMMADKLAAPIANGEALVQLLNFLRGKSDPSLAVSDGNNHQTSMTF
ncbi:MULTISPECIES: DNA-processing protein DprA [unclassified Aureimonas]|uniref:DNA-processing protein DprA n=1 Tax=unclassified Aureimonas TaxID=2615206 RepID=UPI0006F67D55|nr:MULTISPECIES: DNA-processing protein DprA [unclassified Aureimonas]KQT58127.1 hypothetical protein ASG62_24745 [Aureimonas sp. Leaf427]